MDTDSSNSEEAAKKRENPRARTHQMTTRSQIPKNLIMISILCLLMPAISSAQPTTSISTTPTTPPTVPTTTIPHEDSTEPIHFLHNGMQTLIKLAVLILIAVSAQLISTVLNMARQMLNVVLIISKIPLFIFNQLCKLCNIFNRQSPTRRYRTIIAIIFLSCIIRPNNFIVQGCDDVASLSAVDNNCVLDENGQNCVSNSVVQLTMPSKGYKACIQMKTNQEVFGSMQLEVIDITVDCQKDSLYFTRDHAINSVYSHRCHKAGSCHGTICEDLDENANIEEIQVEHRKKPGYTRCLSGCGCITCGGCFLCSTSCLFYRTYAQPTSPYIYEVYRCDSWNLEIELKMTWNNETKIVKMSPGLKTTLYGNTTATVTTYSLPTSALFHSTFVQKINGNNSDPSIAFSPLQPSPPGGPQPEVLGSLQCKDQISAEHFDCVFSEKACECLGKGTSVNCHCKTFNLENLMKKHLLPFKTPVFDFIPFENSVQMKPKTSTILQIQVEFQNTTFTRVTTNDRCTAKVEEFKGCFDCLGGADLKLSCDSTTKMPRQATMKCPDMNYPIKCSNRFINTIQMQMSTPKVNINCSISCGSEESFVSIQGNLEYSPSFMASEKFNSVYNALSEIEIPNPFNVITRMFDWIHDTIYVIIFLTAMVCLFFIAKIILSNYPPLRTFLFIRQWRVSSKSRSKRQRSA